ncbi:ankyrin repeat domain-containing protein [Blastopirellula marina]|uniref:Ankyrin domain protein n=1 Tax=Blastopirellula marina DSM 3645 TaxID=314230 RepID=A4A1M5_9BACT|nr:ankyrin repeat domain-containing protein [Blastopirellula marina]EAQ77330.1 ankyrin domain protein [Blastopirellula marina DSM 3645]
MFTLLRFAAKFSLASAMLAVVGMIALLSLTPAEPSPPLVSAAGITLDDETAALLVDLVFQAARDDDAVTIHEYLGAGFSPNVRSSRGDTLLIVASYHDSRDVVDQLLLAKELDLEARNRMGLTAVSAAAFKGFDETLTRLIRAGANVNSANGMQQTAIMFAALAGKSSTVEILKQAGANAAASDALGNTPASLAANQGAYAALAALRSRSESDHADIAAEK